VKVLFKYYPIVIIIFITIIGFTLFACGDRFNSGEYGTVTINLGSDGRSLMDWPPSNEMLKEMKYEIVFSQGSNRQLFNVSGVANFKVSVKPGNWNVLLKAYYQGRLYAEGKNFVVVKSKQQNIVTVQMCKAFGEGGGEEETYIVTFNSNGGSAVQPIPVINGNTVSAPTPTTTAGGATLNRFRGWYTDDGTFANAFNFNTNIISDITLYADWGYRPGDTGTGGGIVYYRDNAGFTVTASPAETPTGRDWTAYTAHYLEVARTNEGIVGWSGNNTLIENVTTFTSSTASEASIIYREWKERYLAYCKSSWNK
jgi:hypothetical protein